MTLAHQALTIAYEQVDWWRSHGFTAIEAMAAIGLYVLHRTTWGDVAFAAALEWVEMSDRSVSTKATHNAPRRVLAAE